MRRWYVLKREPLGSVMFRFLLISIGLAIAAGIVFEVLVRLFAEL